MKKYHGSCHCKRVEFEAELDITDPLKCNCSICYAHSATMHRVKPENFKVIKGEKDLTSYQFLTKTAEYYFCKHCGIYVFHHPRTNPEDFVINLACVEGINVDDLTPRLLDGASL